MSSLLNSVQNVIDAHDLLSAGERVVVGVSGGVDSVVCAHVLQRLGFDVVAAHVNYGLRAEADADAAFVREWCASQEPAIPCHETTVDPEEDAENRDTSMQEVAREQRYTFFAEVARKAGTDVVAVGHHRDDQAETLLLNLLRGSGPEGLAGMRPSRPFDADAEVRLVRPLLDVSRDAIETYAENEGLSWRTDVTNATAKYRRNAIRHEVVPRLSAIEPNAVDNIARAATLMREYVDDVLRPELDEWFSRCYEERATGGALDLKTLTEASTVWRRRVILEALSRDLPDAPQSRALAEEVEALLDAQVGRRVELPGGTLWRGRREIRLLPHEAVPPPVPATPVPRNIDVSLPRGTLRVDEVDGVPDTLDTGTSNVVYADADRLPDPLVIRTWDEGDRFRPLGLEGTKSVSDVLTDERVAPWVRPHVYVLCADERIVWIVGYRLDHRVRVRSETNQACRLRFAPRENPVFPSQLSG